ncbi:uncharacterized protein VTP21DRAFT_3337 [Calcarisporiella thermophila]|uniref:uncharacterized protein n=1 Tax=Calcarisporiella thermophila TaxID=911321 RepID=UPI0037425240
MRLNVPVYFLFLLPFIQVSYTQFTQRRDYDQSDYYAMEIESGVSPLEVARHLDLVWEGPVGELPNHHLFRMGRRSENYLQQRLLERRLTSPSETREHTVVAAVKWVEKQVPHWRHKRVIPMTSDQRRSKSGWARRRKRQRGQSGKNGSNFRNIVETLGIKDPWFGQQWHLYNDVGNDLNVTGAWEQGITGKGVIVSIIDDGVDMHSEDIRANFYAPGSHDFNDNADLPLPRLSDDYHGTRCAGEIAAVKNSVCGVGVAFDAKVSGIRILSGAITDVDEAAALNYAYQENAIYSCSWGPPDNGQAMEAPREIIQRALENGARHGRGGKGSIYVFATGNGGYNEDNCNFDGYTNSIYTTTIGAIDYMNSHPLYSERCAAQLAVTYSSGSGGYIFTTDVGSNTCTNIHGGTSAAAPLAAGVFALVLSVRPDLSWRDIQRLCVETSVPISPNDPEWQLTAAGRKFNPKFGYGKLDAGRMLDAAANYTPVGPLIRLDMPIEQVGWNLPQSAQGITSMVEVRANDVLKLKRLEHVGVILDLEHEQRGDVEVYLISPWGVTSQLASRRRLDMSGEGFKNWTFSSVQHWDEDPVGTWSLRVVDRVNPEKSGRLNSWQLILYGEEFTALKESEPTLSVAPGDTKPIEKEKAILAKNTSIPLDSSFQVGPLPSSYALPSHNGSVRIQSAVDTISQGATMRESNLLAVCTCCVGMLMIIGLIASAVMYFNLWGRLRSTLAKKKADPCALAHQYEFCRLGVKDSESEAGDTQHPLTREESPLLGYTLGRPREGIDREDEIPKAH